MELSLATPAAIGFVLGLRHAFEPDHIAAVTTLAGRRSSLRSTLALGLAWSLGHTATVGVAALLAALLGLRLPPRFESAAELAVAALLVAMGIGVIVRWRRGHWHLHAHRHDGTAHVHIHSHAHGATHDHRHPKAGPWWALGIGVLHGFAGSGAVLALLIAAGSARGAMGSWFAAFGMGTIAGMLLVTGVLWGAMQVAVRGGTSWVTALKLAAAVAAVVVGVALAGRVLAGS